MRNPQIRTLILGLTLCLCAATAAQSASIVRTDSVPLTKTNWTQSLTVPQFDPALGTLQSVKFTLGSHVEGSAKFESLDAASATVTMKMAATVRLSRLDATAIVATTPTSTTVDTVARFDGTIDFDGTSGKTYPSLFADASESYTSPPPIPPWSKPAASAAQT